MARTRGLNRRGAGQDWERAAESFLTRRGLNTLKRNFQCRHGEIDLVMRHGGSVVFVEVRYRKRAGFGSGAESVGAAKQHRIAKTAAYFLSRHRRYAAQPCRFDVISVGENDGRTEFDWIRNAFESILG